VSLRRAIRWVPYDGLGLEHLTIAEVHGGRPHDGLERDLGHHLRVRSTVIGHKDGADYGFLYDVFLRPDWTFISVAFQSVGGRSAMIHSDGEGNWTHSGGKPLPELQGCIDIDISGTPFTNTLPIRRNRDWVIGEPRRFDMTWVPLDTLEPFRDGQIYTPLGGGKWRYQAADGSFEAEITVDEDGLVLDYPGLFRRAK